MKRHRIAIILLLVIALPILMIGLFILVPDAGKDVQSARQGVQSATPFPSDFILINHLGETVTRQDFSDKYLLVFFGFTYCPDICPTELSTTTRALKMLDAAQLEKVQPLFISIDPERDTAQQMANYVSLFHPKLIGLTGSREQIDTVTKDFKVYAAKRPAENGDKDAYMMDHSSYSYLIAPDGSLIDIISHKADAGERVRILRSVL